MTPAFSILDCPSLLHAVAAAVDDPLLVFDPDGHVVLCNPSASRRIAKAEQEVLGSPISSVVPEIASRVNPFVVEAGAAARAPQQAAQADCPESCAWSVHPLLDDEGKSIGGYCIWKAASGSCPIERDGRRSEQRLHDFVEAASDWFWETDHELRYVYLSDRYQESTGLRPESRLGHRRGDFRLGGPDDGDWDAHMADLQARRPFRDFVFAYLDASRQRRVAKVSGRPVFDDAGEFVGYRGVGRDITTEIEIQQKIRFLAQHDFLTGLPNRSLLEDRLHQVVAQARRAHSGLAVLCVDLDDFKLVNDTLGHAAGDALLCEMARRMQAVVRENDTVARQGGDEFTLIQTDARGWEDARAMAERLLRTLSEPVDLGDEQVECGASIGISLYPNDGEEPDELIRNADLALYKAKATDGSSYCFFLPEMNQEVRERRQIEEELRETLKNDMLLLCYQPQIDLTTGDVVGLEGLLRWRHPQGGLVSPGEFIRVAERSRLILAIDRWVLRAACAQADRWLQAGLLPRRLAVNVSSAQLARADLLDLLADTLAGYEHVADHLEIEITESVLLKDTEEATRNLALVHNLGISLAVDDFGTGYSSLTYLRRFPVQKVKIDRSFVRNICSDPEDASIVRAIISLGHSLGLRVVAEGVETQEQLEHLSAAGCDEAQGYLIAQPLNAEDCEVFLRNAAERKAGKMSIAPIGGRSTGWPRQRWGEGHDRPQSAGRYCSGQT